MKYWWEGYPWRMIQMNLREIDMADMDADAYAQQLQDFGATVAMLNAAGIIASYDTKLTVQTKSDYLKADSLNNILDACHRRGIRVIARTDFSKVRYALYQQHPEWAYRTSNGKIVNYNGDVQVCLNGEYQQTHMFTILQEVLKTHPFDGVYCNMSGFLVTDYSGRYYGPCHCEACKNKFREQYGLELPSKDDPYDPAYHKYISFKGECIKEHTQKLIHTVKAINEDIAINNVDYLRVESATEIGVPHWPYEASSKARQAAGPLHKRPADNASVDFMGFRYRDTSVSPALMALRQWQSLANAGSVSLYIMGRMDNHLDISGFEPTRRAFEFHKQHEEFYVNAVSAAKVAVIHKAVLARNDPEVCGWVRALTESHIPFDEVKLTELEPALLTRWNTVILGDAATLNAKQTAMLDDYVRQGGTLLATGNTGIALDGTPVLDCLGVKTVKERMQNLMSSVLLVPKKEKTHFPRCSTAPYIPLGTTFTTFAFKKSVKGYLRRVPEHPFGPPERCYYTDVTDQVGVAVSSYGSGRCVFLPWLPGSFYFTEGYQNTLNLMQDILFEICGLPQIAPQLSPMVEVALTKKNETTLLHLVNTSGVFGNSNFDPVPIYGLKFRLPPDLATRVQAHNGGNVSIHNTAENLVVELDVLHEYEVITLSR